MKRLAVLVCLLLCALMIGAFAESVTETDGFAYYVDYDSAVITDYVGEKTDAVVIPITLDGTKVKRLTPSLFENHQDVKLWVIPSNAYLEVGEENAPDRPVTFAEIKYSDYRNLDGYYLKKVPEMQKGEYALLNYSQYTIYPNGQMDSSSGYVNAEMIPSELFGAKAYSLIDDYYIAYEKDGYRYILNDDRLKLLQLPEENAGGMILVPETVDGRPVQLISVAAVPETAEIVLLPDHCWTSSDNDQKRDFVYYSYWSFENEDLQGNSYYEDYVKQMGPEDLLLRRVTHYADGSDNDFKVEYCDIPVAFGNRKLVSAISEYDIKTHESGVYSYVKLNEREIQIVAFSENTAHKVIVPAQLDGLTVVSIGGLGLYSSYAIHPDDASEIELPSTLRELGNRAISSSDITALTLPDGLTSIGNEAIYAWKLKKLVIPEGVTYLGSKFLHAYKCKEITIPSSVTTLADNCFSQSYVKKLIVPDTVENIGKGAFSNMYSLSALTLPSGMSTIPAELCKESDRLSKITIPAGVTGIGESAFAGCKKLSAVTFAGEAVKKIEKYAFSDCAALSKLKLPEGLETIEEQAFYNCKKLASLTLPQSLSTIGNHAFNNCAKLSKVIMGENITSIGDGAFDGCSKKLTVVAPEGSYAYRWAEKMGYKVSVK